MRSFSSISSTREIINHFAHTKNKLPTRLLMTYAATKYRKIPKISPGAYILKALFEGLIFGGAYIRRDSSTEGNLHFKIDWASLIVGSKFTVFALFYFVFEGNFPSTSPRGGLYMEGLIFRNFTVQRDGRAS